MAGIRMVATVGPVAGPHFRLPRDSYTLITDNLQAEFDTHFAITRATSPQQRDEGFRMRHGVYCEELRFEPIRPDGREYDEYDGGAEHLLIRSVRTEAFVGCARVVMPHDLPHALPVERSGAWKAARPLRDPQGHAVVAELSRLAVVHEFRRRKGEQDTPINVADEDFGTPARPRFPHIPVGLYLGALAVADRRTIATLIVLTEERLARHFGRLGVRLAQVGDAVEFHRMRAPYLMSVRETVDRLPPVIRTLYDKIYADIWSQSQ